MTTLTLAELRDAEGLDLGAGPWHLIEQSRIDAFADATLDHQWIHVDPVAAADGPFGATIAHGHLTLSLVPSLLEELLTLSDSTVGINYGLDRARFTSPVRVGSRIRLRAAIGPTEPWREGVRYAVEVTVEIEGEERAALVARIVLLAA